MNKLRHFLLLTLMLGVMSGLISAGSTSALTFSSDADISFTFNPMISISLSSADLVIPELAPGSMADSNEITVTVTTNTAYGYTLNATVGQEDDYETRDLVLDNNGSGNSNSVTAPVFSSLNFGASEATIATDSTWGYAYRTSETNSTWSNYSGLPLYSDNDNVTTLIDTDAAAASDYITFKIGARASTTQASGEYKNVINFIAVANPEPQLGPVACEGGKICYNVNALSGTEGTMGRQTASADGASVTLLASNYSRAGYGFAGWSDVYDYDINPNAKFYGPNETITVPNGTTADGLSLYAVWIKSVGYLQNSAVVNTLCGNGSNSLTIAPTDGTANLDSVSALTDQRDDETYAVAKLADGKCWMIENLRLDNSATLTIANTNKPLNDGTNVTLKHNYSDTETYNTLSASQDPTTTAWCTTNAASCDDQSMLFTGNTTNRASGPTANGVAMYSYGNYYNWYSATAGNGTYSFGTNNNSVAGDLCPAGWHLPKGGRKANVDVSDFWKLSRATIGVDPANFANDYFYYTGTPEGTDASNKMRTYPNNFVYSGSVSSGSVGSRGSYGYYWSSTAVSSNYAYNLSLSSSNVYPGTINYYKYNGRTVRCVAPGI